MDTTSVATTRVVVISLHVAKKHQACVHARTHAKKERIPQIDPQPNCLLLPRSQPTCLASPRSSTHHAGHAHHSPFSSCRTDIISRSVDIPSVWNGNASEIGGKGNPNDGGFDQQREQCGYQRQRASAHGPVLCDECVAVQIPPQWKRLSHMVLSLRCFVRPAGRRLPLLRRKIL